MEVVLINRDPAHLPVSGFTIGKTYTVLDTFWNSGVLYYTVEDDLGLFGWDIPYTCFKKVI